MAARGPRAGSRNPETVFGPRCQGTRRGRLIENVELGLPTSANRPGSARISGEENRLRAPGPWTTEICGVQGPAAWCLSEARERLCRQDWELGAAAGVAAGVDREGGPRRSAKGLCEVTTSMAE